MGLKDEASRVIIFDDYPSSLLVDFAAQGAQEAGWDPEVYSDPSDALARMDSGVGALVTALGTNNSLIDSMMGNFPALPLLNRSNSTDVPRALLSGHPRAADYTRPNSNDIVVSKREPLRIASTVMSWLVDLDRLYIEL